MKKTIINVRHYLAATLFAVLVCLLFGLNTNAATTGKAYVSVEKFTIGQGYLIEPCEVSITDGEPLSVVIERVLKANGYEPIVADTGYGWYLAGIKNANSGLVKVPLCFKNKWREISGGNDKDLGGQDYLDYGYSSCWMFLQNNKGLDFGASSTQVYNGDVIALRYSLTGGNDIGIPYGTPYLLLPNLDSLTKSMAIFNANKQLCVEKGYQAAYNEALSFASNMDAHVIADDKSNQSQIEAKIQSLCSKLPTEATINQWKAEKAAAEQAALAQAEEARKVALYTPAVPTLKSVKSTKTRTAVITWKKNKKATGYEIYMSTKKASGYKKVATIKKWKKITYTKKKLKKNKKYYFKVRAYKTAEGKKYYSAYSKVKAVKVK